MSAVAPRVDPAAAYQDASKALDALLKLG